MPGVKGYFAVVGEAVRNLFRPNVTNLFPYVPPTPTPPGFRGAPVVNPEICTVCRTCERRCPSHAIKISGPVEAPDTPEGKEAYEYALTYAQCMFCQTCEEFCPEGRKEHGPAIKLTEKWDLAAYSVEDTVQKWIVFRKARPMKED
ncbi:MAG: 4Fe-4S binding protein [Candidatus Odinarchaeota archaeon]